MAKRKGTKPSILCEDLTQQGLEEAIDRSPSFKKYLEYLDEELGPRPWALQGNLEFLGFDGGPILKPVLIEFSYYGQKPQKEVDAFALVARAMEMQHQANLARETTRQVELQTAAQVRAVELQAEAERRKAELSAQADLYKAAVTQAPNEHLVRALDETRKAETERADQATGDVMKGLKGAGAGGKPEKDLMDLAVQAKELWPVAKDMLGFLLKKKPSLPN